MLAVAILGLAVVALMQAMVTTARLNTSARELGMAVNLARHVHEYAMSLNMSRVDALNGKTFAPIGSDGKPLSGYDGWQQTVSVALAPAESITGSGVGTGSKIRRVTVEAKYKGAVVHRESWLLAPVGL